MSGLSVICTDLPKGQQAQTSPHILCGIKHRHPGANSYRPLSVQNLPVFALWSDSVALENSRCAEIESGKPADSEARRRGTYGASAQLTVLVLTAHRLHSPTIQHFMITGSCYLIPFPALDLSACICPHSGMTPSPRRSRHCRLPACAADRAIWIPPQAYMSNTPMKALQEACEAGREAEVRRLLQTHKHSSALKLLNSSCLSLAARGGHLGVVEVLLSQNDYLPPADGQVGSVKKV